MEEGVQLASTPRRFSLLAMLDDDPSYSSHPSDLRFVSNYPQSFDVFQGALARRPGARTPLIIGFGDRLMFWPLRIWVFAAPYVAVRVYVLALLWIVPPRWRAG